MECNIDYSVWQDNIISIRVTGGSQAKSNKITLQDLLTMSDSWAPRTKTQIEQVSRKLLTLCSVLKEKPYVMYQQDSMMAESVAMNFYQQLENLWNQIDEK